MITYDPYEFLPFIGYASPEHPLGERYFSLMHFIESEKFRGVDEDYRSYLRTLDDPVDFRLETVGVAQCRHRADWDGVKASMIQAGLWMQLVQRQEELRERVLIPDCSTGIHLIDDAARAIYKRLVEANKPEEALRRVVLTGDADLDPGKLKPMLDGIFQSRLPDEIYLLQEQGVARLAGEYAISRYIPVRVFAETDAQEAAVAVMVKGTHVFSFGREQQPSTDFSRNVLALAEEQGKTAHHIHVGD